MNDYAAFVGRVATARAARVEPLASPRAHHTAVGDAILAQLWADGWRPCPLGPLAVGDVDRLPDAAWVAYQTRGGDMVVARHDATEPDVAAALRTLADRIEKE